MHSKFFQLLLILGLSALGAHAQQNLDAQFDPLVEAQYQKPGAPGAAVLVAKKGQVVYHKAFGMANLELDVPLRTDHVFRIGSVTKQFTAAAILQLMEQGKLSLDDEITKFIPDYPTQGERITVEHLLTHTSGIKSYTGMKEFSPMQRRKDLMPLELVDFFKDQPMEFKPGTQWRYNNSGYILLGYIIEKVAGKPYGEYIAETLFKPLGMTRSYYGAVEPVIKNRVPGYSQADVEGTYANSPYLSMTQPYAAGSLLSTVEDLYIWNKALHGGKVLKPETLRKATAPYKLADGSDSHYGYGLQTGNLLGSSTIEHSGGIPGFLSFLLYVPGEDICVAILTNCDCNPPGELAARLAALAAGKPLKPAAIKLPVAALEPYVGVYEHPKDGQRVITLEDGSLYSMRTGGSKFKLVPFTPNQFYFEESFARISFVQEKGTKKVQQAVVSDRTANDHVWVRTDKPLPAARAEIKVPEAELEKYVGEYQLMPGFNIAITREGQRLFAQATGQDRLELFAEKPARFFMKVVAADIEFYPDGTAKAPRLVLFQGGQEMEGKRVK
jgi:CubicO group peptidase (beta-lactamase class C family)